MNLKLIFITWVLVLGNIHLIQSQHNKKELFNTFYNSKNSSDSRYKSGYSLVYNYYLKTQLDSAYLVANQLKDICRNKSCYADAIHILGLVHYNLNNDDEAIKLYSKSLELYKAKNDIQGQVNTLNNIGLLFSNQYRFKTSIQYLKEAFAIAQKKEDYLSLYKTSANLGFVFNNSFKTDSALVYLNKALKISKQLQTPSAFILLEIGKNHVKRKNYDAALKYYNSALEECKNTADKNLETSVLFHMSTLFIFKKDYKSSIPYSKQSLELAKATKDHYGVKSASLNLYESYKALGNTKMALHYLEQDLSHDQYIEEIKTNKALQEFQIKQIRLRDSLVREQKKLKQKLQYQKEKSTNRLLWVGSLSSVAFIGLIGYRKVKQKQIKTEAEKQIQIQKNLNLLKEKEIASINAMIEGQEKERQKIANDLHDELGSIMATIKMHFSTFKNKDSEKLYQHTNDLIEEAYQKVRTIAHAKNAGVMANQGLLKAVEDIAEKISVSNNLQIDVLGHGLDKRLENSLELTIFRIIQELITNIIKHAQATEVTIHLTNHDDTINLMIEDNGKGFNTNQITKNSKGMGLSSIDKRVEHLDGKMIIESEKNKGTSVIIDIPL